ncbi:hypothetical protein GCM10017687_01920 [Streptomyces echinatus]
MQRDNSTDRIGPAELPDGTVGLAVLLRAWRARAGRTLGLGRPLPQTEVAAAGRHERAVVPGPRTRHAAPAGRPDPVPRWRTRCGCAPTKRATLFLYAAGGEPFPPCRPVTAPI